MGPYLSFTMGGGTSLRHRARRIRDPALRRDSCRRRRLLGHVGLHLDRRERPDEVEPHLCMAWS